MFRDLWKLPEELLIFIQGASQHFIPAIAQFRYFKIQR